MNILRKLFGKCKALKTKRIVRKLGLLFGGLSFFSYLRSKIVITIKLKI